MGVQASTDKTEHPMKEALDGLVLWIFTFTGRLYLKLCDISFSLSLSRYDCRRIDRAQIGQGVQPDIDRQ
jgi:hypothetical protein